MAAPSVRLKKPIRFARSVVKRVSDVLKQESFQQSVGIKASEIFVGGSLGQGTIVHEHYDIDLVLYSTSLLPSVRFDPVENGYDDILVRLNEYLRIHLKEAYVFLGKTKVALNFKMRSLDVDLLLSPLWGNRDELFTYLRTIPPRPAWKRLMFSVSTSKDQVKFMMAQPQRARRLIARFKAWRNDTWKDANDGRPKSYLLSLLVVTAYYHAPEGPKRARKLKRLASWVTKEVKRLVKMIHKDKHLDLSIPGGDPKLRETYSDLLPEPPRIIDPVNPSNNVYLSGISKSKDNGWDIFAQNIDSVDLSGGKPEIHILPQSFSF